MEMRSLRLAIVPFLLLGIIAGACQPVGSLSVAAPGPVDTVSEDESIAICEEVLQVLLEPAIGAVATVEPGNALSQCQVAAVALQKAGEWDRLARVYAALGILHWEAGDWRSALTCYETRLSLTEQAGDALETARVSANLGMLYLACGQAEKAAEYVAHGHLIAVAEGNEVLANQTDAQLVGILGTAEAATEYLQQIAGDEAPPAAY